MKTTALFLASALLISACASEQPANNSPAQSHDLFAQWQQQAQAGQANAQYKLGTVYAAKQQYSNAAHWLEKAANQGNAPAQNGLSMLYLQGVGVAKDEAQALEWLKKSVQQGYPTAQYNLAMLYKNGRIIAKDESQAAAWLQQAAIQGDGQAQVELGMFYQLGIGVARNNTLAMEWLKKAAAQGNEEAKNRLAELPAQ